MSSDRLQTQRFELKYLVSEQTAQAVSRYLSCFLKPDDFAAKMPDYAYPVHSVYLDSGDLATYHAVQSGDKNRFKLRLRYYGPNDKVIYFEIKRRTTEVISKMRAGVHRWAVQPLLSGRPPQMQHLARPSAHEFRALQEFCRLMHVMQATPRSHVGYMREAWAGPFNCSIRVTFDRNVECEPQFGMNLPTTAKDAVTPFEKTVILELKFVDRMPGWCAEMVRLFSLNRGGAPKYAWGVWTMGEHRISNQGVGLKLPVPAGQAAAGSGWRQPEPLAVPAA